MIDWHSSFETLQKEPEGQRETGRGDTGRKRENREKTETRERRWRKFQYERIPSRDRVMALIVGQNRSGVGWGQERRQWECSLVSGRSPQGLACLAGEKRKREERGKNGAETDRAKAVSGVLRPSWKVGRGFKAQKRCVRQSREITVCLSTVSLAADWQRKEGLVTSHRDRKSVV